MENSTPEYQEEIPASPEELRQQRQLAIGLSIGGIVILILLGLAIYFLLQNPVRTMLVRDVMVILIAFEMLLIGISIVLLLIQITRLVNLLQNEIKPLLDSANETIFTLRGTASFISDSLLEPVIKFNSFVAGFKRVIDLLNIIK